MTYEQENELYEPILKSFNATNIYRYCLINNWGYTFEIAGKPYDARFMANMYGFCPNCFNVFTRDGDHEIAKQIEIKLNNVKE